MVPCGKVERLVQAYLDNELSPSERVVFEQHTAGCSACAERLAHFTETSASLYSAFGEAKLDHSLRAKVMAHLPEMDYYGEHHPSWQPQYKPIRFQWMRTLAPALAPILVLLLGFTLIYAWPSSDLNGVDAIGMITHASGDIYKSNPVDAAQRAVALSSAVHAEELFETRPGSSLMVALAGPSLLKAGPGTTFRILDNRKIRLEVGRIWFDVAKDNRTFLVETPSGEVSVFGTAFDVNVEGVTAGRPQKMTVTVASGTVQVGSGAGFRRITPGERVQVSKGQKEILAERVDAASEMAWATRIQPSVQVAERFVLDGPAQGAPGLLNNWEHTFLVWRDNQNQNLTSLVLSWEPDALSSNHSGYYVYVSDIHLNAVAVEHIPGSTFDSGKSNAFVIEVPPMTATGASDYHVRCVADRTGTEPVGFKYALLSN